MDVVWYLRLFYVPIINMVIAWLLYGIIQAKRMGNPEFTKSMNIVYVVLFIVGIVLMWFVTFSINSAFWLGVGIIIIGHILNSLAYHAMREHPEKKKSVVDWGIYKFSRHPHILHGAIILLGTIIIGWNVKSIIYGVLWVYFVLNLIMTHYAVLYEEKRNLEKFGKEYEDYMNKTPRYMGIPK